MASYRKLRMTHLSLSQRKAINPQISCWVEASAGTGKTKVLIDRILALLLQGVLVEKILCLTFTKAAAAEMLNRLRARLSHWASLDDAALSEEIRPLLNCPLSQKILKKARALFSDILEVPNGIKIQTIHGFCQFLLRTFPLESDLLPHFKVMDEREALHLKNEALDKTLQEIEPSIVEKFATLSSFSEYQALMLFLCEKRNIIEKIFHLSSPDQIKHHLKNYLEIGAIDSIEDLLCYQMKDRDFSSLRALLKTGTEADQKFSESLGMNSILNFDAYKNLFLTHKGEIRKKLISKSLLEKAPQILGELEEESQRVQAIYWNIHHFKVINATYCLLKSIEVFLKNYKALKRQHSLLDYDDLILKTAELLKDAPHKPWILLKLGSSIDHVLIDEAQDTSQSQWALISNLVQDFFTLQNSCTLFVVGDMKQSIYSFQGAEPLSFHAMKELFKKAAILSGKRWEFVDLSTSYRSTEAVLTLIDFVCSKSTLFNKSVTSYSYTPHEPHRSGHEGIVELWPLITRDKKEERPEWDPPVIQEKEEVPRVRLAHLIADQIHEWLKGSEWLASRGRPIKPSDIMILVRRRDIFIEELVRALKAYKIPVTGVDRMILTEQLAVMDLLAVTEFILLPQDDLNLAVVLKSPLVGLSEEQLFDIAHARGEVSLWAHLKTLPAYQEVYAYLKTLQERAETSSLFNFYGELLVKDQGKRKFLERLGPDAEDALEEFLNVVLKYEEEHGICFQNFLNWIQRHPLEIKRNLEQTEEDKVRILTVHGAKGLQAPIVFLPDTTQLPRQHAKVFWNEKEPNLLMWLPSGSFKTPKIEEFCNSEKDLEEYQRLMYVALTRAEDRLYICGWETRQPLDEKSWYSQVEKALQEIGSPFNFKDLGTGWQLRNPQKEEVTIEPQTQPSQKVELPSWVSELPPLFKRETSLSPSTASSFVSPLEPALIPTEKLNPLAAERGILIHKILQFLIKAAPHERSEILRRYLKKLSLVPEEETLITKNIDSVLNHPKFNFYFNAETSTEVPLVGWFENRKVKGVIDVLTVNSQRQEIYIVDYKTGLFCDSYRLTPPLIYIQQMKIYKKILQDIYPTFQIFTALLWTDGGWIQEV